MKHLISVLVLFVVASTTSTAATISSTSSGGLWSSGSTWNGGTVPGSSDDVIINGTVYVVGSACNNLTISSGAALMNRISWSETLTVNGDIVNNGTITNNGSYNFTITSNGSGITNNGAWNNYNLNILRAGTVTFAGASGKKFEGMYMSFGSDTSINAELGSDVTFQACTFTNGTSSVLKVINTNGFSAEFLSCDLNYFSILSDDNIDFDGSTFTNLDVEGYAKISGQMYIITCNLRGNITNQGTLQNRTNWSQSIGLYGSFVNEGTIRNNPGSGYSLTVIINGDFLNKGSYSPSYTQFSAGATHHLSQSAATEFHGEFYNYPTDTIKLTTDVVFKSAYLDGSNSGTWGSILTNGYKLTLDSCTIQEMNVIGNDGLNFNGTYLSSISLIGNFSLYGITSLGPVVTFDGTSTIYGTVQNRSNWSETLTVIGQLNNRGTIRRDPNSGYSLIVDLLGDIYNDGVYQPSATYLKGQVTHSFSQSKGKSFEGSLYTADTSDRIELNSAFVFKKMSFDGANNHPFLRINTNTYHLHLDSCVVYQMSVIGDDTLNAHGSSIDEFNAYGDMVLEGQINVINNVNLYGNITLDGILQNRPNWSQTVNIYGNLTNQGTIRNNPVSGYSFYVNLYSNLVNDGVYNPYITYLMGQKTHLISQTKDHPLQGGFQSLDTLDIIQLASDLSFKKTPFDGPNTYPYLRFYTAGNNLTFDSCSVYQVSVVGNDTLHGHGSFIDNFSAIGNMVMDGEINVVYEVDFNGNITNNGILQNRPNWTHSLDVFGKLINNGIIRNNPISGYSFYVNLYSDVENNGKYAPRITYLYGDLDHVFDGIKPYEGDFSGDDKDGKIRLGSASGFHNSTIDLGSNGHRKSISTNGHSLTLDTCFVENVIFEGGDSLKCNEVSLSSVNFKSSTYLHGLVYIYAGVVFDDTLNNFATLMNRANWSEYLTLNGNLINRGIIQSNPVSGYSLHINSYGDINNRGTYAPVNTYLLGKASRTIGGPAAKAMQGNFYLQDTITLHSSNSLPNLTMNNTSWLTIDTAARLECNGFNYQYTSRITNLGSISTSLAINPATSTTYTYYQATGRNKSGSDIQGLMVESYGYQQHPSTEGAAQVWWRLKPTPSITNDSLQNLTLSYHENQLNGNSEDQLSVYFSPNAGLAWHKIDRGVTRDTANNTLSITSAPPSGHYVLSSTDIGIVAYDPWLQRAEPRLFGNKGQVTLYGFGLGLRNDMTVSLQKSGSTTIVADSVHLTDANGESFLAIFNVDLIDVGDYSVVVDIPGSSSLQLTDYIKIEAAERPAPWAMLGGRNRFLINRWTTFTLNYGNNANSDARGVPLFFVVNDVANMEVEFPDVEIGVPTSFLDDGWTQWQDTTVELYFLTDSFTGFEGTMMRIYPFYVPSIGAWTSESVRVRIKVPSQSSLNMAAWITDPLIEGFQKQLKASTPPEVTACIAAAAAKYTWDKAIGFIPGYDCYKLGYKVTETAVTEVLKDPKEPAKPATWGSWVVSGWGWAWSIADCASDLIPVSKGVKVGVDLVTILFDMKTNSDAHQDCWDKFKAKQKGKFKSKGVFSFDPNEIVGPTGYGSDGYVGSEANMIYTVFFENKDSATAPASEVLVTDTLDKTLFDLRTFSFNTFTISDSTYYVQSFANKFRILVDLAPRIYSIVQVTGEIDTSNGAIQVQYVTLDRSTLELNEDVDLGFLPPNKNKPEGEGNFSYSVALRDDNAHDAFMENKALIFFDANKPIATNVHSNRLDILAPQSSVTSFPAISKDSTFTVTWTGSDEGCGIQGYSVFVSVNDSDYVAWKSYTSLTSADFKGHDKYRYKFYSIAVDSLGLTEKRPQTADAVTEVDATSSVRDILEAGFRIYPNPAKHILIVEVLQTPAARLQLYDVHGGLVLETMLNSGTNSIDISSLPARLYLVHLNSGDQHFQGKVVVMP